MIKFHRQPLVFYCAVLEIVIPLLTLLLLWIPVTLGYDPGDGGIDSTSAYSAFISIAGFIATFTVLEIGIMNGIKWLIKPAGFNRKLIALYTFGPVVAVASLYLLFR